MLNIMDLVSLDEYQKSRSHIFPSTASIEWFIRQNREVLMAHHALSYPTRKIMAHAKNFDQAIFSIGQKAVQR